MCVGVWLSYLANSGGWRQSMLSTFTLSHMKNTALNIWLCRMPTIFFFDSLPISTSSFFAARFSYLKFFFFCSCRSQATFGRIGIIIEYCPPTLLCLCVLCWLGLWWIFGFVAAGCRRTVEHDKWQNLYMRVTANIPLLRVIYFLSLWLRKEWFGMIAANEGE